MVVLRARNYGAKRDRVKALKLKAAMKNPDEFYFAMHRQKTQNGVHTLDGTESLPHDVIQVQYLHYLRWALMTGAREGADGGLQCLT